MSRGESGYVGKAPQQSITCNYGQKPEKAFPEIVVQISCEYSANNVIVMSWGLASIRPQSLQIYFGISHP